MVNPIGEFKGDALQEILADQFSQHEQGIIKTLEGLDANNVFIGWSKTIRSIDEMINIILFELDNEKDSKFIVSVQLDMSINANLARVHNILMKRFSKNVADRFIKLLIMTASISMGFKMQGLYEFGHGISLNTIGDAVFYFQSRRKYLTTILYLIPSCCKGSTKYEETDLLNQFLPIVEMSFVGLTTINQQLLLTRIYRDFKVTSDGHKVFGNYNIDDLERLFMEPERVSIIDKNKHRAPEKEINRSNNIDNTKVLSLNELIFFIDAIESHYFEFGLTDTIFSTYKLVILGILDLQKSDYHITIDPVNFTEILSVIEGKERSLVRKALVFSKAASYGDAARTKCPFIEISGRYKSNVILLNRFMVSIKNEELNKLKRYQIHSGFIFEDMVTEVLSENNFEITGITRINRKEFDVVTIRNQVIYNFQCKNSFLDMQLMYSDQKKFVSNNKTLISYYKRAIKKEEGREGLVQAKLGIKDIKHFVERSR